MITHRTGKPRFGGAGVALLGLIGLSVATTFLDRPGQLIVPAAISGIGLVIVHRSLVVAWRGCRMPLSLVALTALLQAWGTGSGDEAIILFLRFSALVCAAQIVSAVWSWSELCAAMIALLWPFDRLGLLDAKKSAFVLMLAVRFVPVMFEEMAEIREAQALRRLDRSIFALAVPLGLRILLRAEEIAEAVDLRAPSSRKVARGGRGPLAKVPSSRKILS
ncbi:MAG: energy-coupling factor transporter transmembrane protein EcfT [Phyllobacteriaceae bacterium]|nr:energy-coupling factor transporter transmembrane protein EcfT [Phyllobacteriaceae bacterium]